MSWNCRHARGNPQGNAEQPRATLRKQHDRDAWGSRPTRCLAAFLYHFYVLDLHPDRGLPAQYFHQYNDALLRT